MASVERLVTAGSVLLAVEDPTTDDARSCFQAYFDELDARFDGGFDPGTSISAAPDELTAPHGVLLLARLDGKPVGAGAVKFHDTRPAEIKRMWVSPQARGLGVARRILAQLERHARDHGASATRLETNEALTEAIQLYRSAGYLEVAPFNDEPYAHHWFEKDLIGA